MTKKQVSAVFPGSFDPPTLGHIDLIKRSAVIFDKVIIAVAESTSKKYVFSTEERVDLWKRILPEGLDNVEVDTFKGLLVDYMDRKNSRILLRGLRNLTDFEYEISMSQTNQTMNPKVETLFIMTAGSFSHLSSSLIKEIVMLGGSVKGMVSPLVEKELKKRTGPQAKNKK